MSDFGGGVLAEFFWLFKMLPACGAESLTKTSFFNDLRALENQFGRPEKRSTNFSKFF